MLSNRTLWLVGLAGALAASGCVEGDAPAFTVGWDTYYVPVDASSRVSCEQVTRGYPPTNAAPPTVELSMTNLSSHKTYVNTFPCTAQGGESETLPTGRYGVVIALKNDKGQVLSNQEGEWSIVRDGLTDLEVVTFPIQSFQLNWTLARGPNSVSCQEVQADRVNIVTRRNSEPEVVVYSFPCTAGSGSTPAILLGTYAVTLQLMSTTGAVLWQADMPMTIPVGEDARAVLPTVRFDLP
jgi:hypothetical protein